MKNWILLFTLFSVLGFAQKVPKKNKTEFSKAALNQKIVEHEGEEISIAEVLKKHQGKIVLIDFWASWCKDCILALPATKALKEKNPEIDFVYFSLDRSKEQWENGLEKYGISQNENYWFDAGWKNSFNDYIDLNWVPRLMIVDQKGAIAKYYSIHPDDPEIQEVIDQLKESTQ